MASRSRLATAAIGVTAAAAGPAAVMASTYVVRPGDTLADIALRHGTSVQQLAEANEIHGSAVRVGQLLQIPDARLNLPAYAQTAEDIEVHLVGRGDTLFGISHRFGVDPTALARANGINVNTQLSDSAELAVPGKMVRIDALLHHVATEFGVNPDLVKAVAWMESGWEQETVSVTGAVGIMQIEPFTGEWISEHLAGRKLNLHVASDNVLAGTLLLKHLLQLNNGDTGNALAAYYQGAASVTQNGWFTDTRQYVTAVQNLMARG